MSVAIKLSDKLVKEARAYAATYHRSVPKQLEFWMTIGKVAEENPDLPYDFIKGILLSLEEAKRGESEEYKFDS